MNLGLPVSERENIKLKISTMMTYRDIELQKKNFLMRGEKSTGKIHFQCLILRISCSL